MTTTFDDPNIVCRNEYDSLEDVYFKDKPFTGTIVDDLDTINYKDGIVHGQVTSRYRSGQLSSVETYENGDVVCRTTYYMNGQKETEFLNGSYYNWTNKGVLYKKDNEYYFENGKLRSLNGNEDDNFKVKHFTPEGDLISTERKDVRVNDQSERIIDYNHDLMYEWYYKLLNIDIAGHSEYHLKTHVYMWFWKIFEQDQEKYFKIVNTLLTHPMEEVVKRIALIIAVHRFHPYIQSENHDNSKAYQFIKEYTEYQDSMPPDRKTKRVVL